MAVVAQRRFSTFNLYPARRSGMVDELRRSSLFSAASDRDLRRVARSAEIVVLPADHQVTRQGQRIEEFLIVMSGQVAITTDSKLVRMAGPGTWLGALPLMRRSRSHVAVVSLTPVRLLCLGPREFWAFADAVPGFAARLLADVARGNITPLDASMEAAVELDGWADDRRCG